MSKLWSVTGLVWDLSNSSREQSKPHEIKVEAMDEKEAELKAVLEIATVSAEENWGFDFKKPTIREISMEEVKEGLDKQREINAQRSEETLSKVKDDLRRLGINLKD